MNLFEESPESAPRILVADDTPESWRLLQVVLKKQGYEVLLAHNGHAAIDVVATERPDLILLDVMMPGLDGFAVCEHLKANADWEDIPVIFMTALGDVEDKIRAFEVGAVDYLVKPFVLPEVGARIRVHLELRRALRRLQTQAVTDPLTGAYNRRFAFEVLEKSLRREDRRPESILLCYLDIDGLKQVNDGHGHREGDRLIQSVVTEIRAVMRSSDYLCRMGGDEFLLITFDSEVENGRPLMERVISRLQQRTDLACVPRFSFGCAAHGPGDLPVQAATLIARADEAMYRMKQAPRRVKPSPYPSQENRFAGSMAPPD